MTAGRFARAAENKVHISWGSHGVRVIRVPRGKFSCRSCSGWGSAWVGPSSPVLTPAWAQIKNEGPERFGGDRLPGLTADGMEPGGDVAQGRDEGPIGRAYAEVAPKRRQSGENPGHGILADPADGKKARPRIGGGVVKPFRKSLGDGVDARGTEQIGGGGEDRSVAHFIVVLKHSSQFTPQRGPLSGR